MELLTLGQRSPVVKAYPYLLRRAYYFTNLFVVLTILAIFAYQKWQVIEARRQASQSGRTTGIILTYAQLGPPPSIKGDEPYSKSTEDEVPGRRLGQPKPVKDSLAVQETAPTQTEMPGPTESFSGRLIFVNQLEVEPMPIYRVDVVPVLIKQVAPVYPEAAKKAGLQGTVVVEGIVNTDGSMINLVIRSSSGLPLLDSAALFTVSQYRFTPGRQKGRAIPVIITIPVEFKHSAGVRK